jgi:uncharacterized protein Smg (DUF494 family)
MFEAVIYMIRRFGPDLDTAGEAQELWEDLLGAGFSEAEVEEALGWVRTLRARTKLEWGWMLPPPQSLRVPSAEEACKLTPQARGLLLRLERAGVLPVSLREAVYDKAQHLDVSELGPEEVSILLALLLQASSWGSEALTSRLLRGTLDELYH